MLIVVIVIVSFNLEIKHSYNTITNPIQVKILNLSLTLITV